MVAKTKLPFPQDKKLLTAKEVCQVLDVSLVTFYRLRKVGPSRKKHQGITLDLRKIPDRWIASRHFYSRAGLEKLLDGML
jgi:hypothetical protein